MTKSIHQSSNNGKVPETNYVPQNIEAERNVVETLNHFFKMRIVHVASGEKMIISSIKTRTKGRSIEIFSIIG